MPRYILIEQNSGFILGEANASSPVEACRQVDTECGASDRTYTEHGPHSAATRTQMGGYFVYEAPADFTADYDGQSEGDIASIEALPRVAFVEARTEND